MVLEKIFHLSVGREAKIVVKGQVARSRSEIVIDYEFLIREKHDIDFREPIGPNHPQYWKLKKSTPERSQLLQLEYSGISRKQLKEVTREFKRLAGAGYTFRYQNEIEERTKYLKGIRVSAMNRRLLSVA
ncbi:hypothetical protein [Dyadobacter fermentans]|uniref:Uncharacterized protein n=1 Tax=Dyadobacter fermentans (strain ATCC 700827 / DSM 18053 / CIP 107007 / KCTC 52180 / NS114) TaxID=471854 RepID=C6W410_DYAFD|nr:hypothetical protein [Dyadobacter fermentans]ACT92247.1 hypothetical protein Dfer_0998 [Dyadobacter fermentans DSM 18053]